MEQNGQSNGCNSMRRMFLGEFSHTIDSKGRIFMPAKFRDQLGDAFVVAKGVDCCLCVYPQEKWEALTAKISALPELEAKALARFLYPSAALAEPDAQGRFLIPLTLRKYAQLGKNVTVIGMGTYAEIWNTEYFAGTKEGEAAEDIRSLMQRLNF